MMKIFCLVFVTSLYVSGSPLFKSVSENSVYDEAYARDRVLPMAAASYSSHPEKCIKQLYKNASLAVIVTEQCDLFNGDDCSGFVAVNHDFKSIIVSFRGSSGEFEITMEFIETVFDKKISLFSGGVSRYFYDAFTLLWSSGMRDAFLTLKNKHPEYTVDVTGHSLGAAIGSIAAATISSEGYVSYDKIRYVSFGEPRVGDAKYVAAFDKLVGVSYRLIHSFDLVPHLPFHNLFGYDHHKVEVYYPKDMVAGSSYTVCDENDDNTECSNKNDPFKLNWDDHDFYFNHHVSDWGISGCV